VWFYTSYLVKKVQKCSLTAANSSPHIFVKFNKISKSTKRVLCKLNHIDVLSRLLKSHSLRTSFNSLFRRLLIKGVKKRKIHNLNWTRIGEAIYTSYNELSIFCKK
jgi:hypothetical protein